MSNIPGVFNANRVSDCAKLLVRGSFVTAGLCFGALAFSTSAQAQDSDPEYFQVNMKPGSTLNVRKDPSLKSEKIGSLPANAEGIANLGCHVGMPYLEWREATTAVRKVETRRKWCNIEYNGMVGWTAGKYLEEDLPE